MVARSSSVHAIARSNPKKSHLCTCMWGSDWLHAGCQEVGKCSTRGESWGMYVTFASAKIANKAEPTSGFETQRRRHQKSKTGVPVAPKKDMCPPKTLKKNKKKNNIN